MTGQNNNPLAYLGVRAKNPANIIEAARAPTSSDTEHLIGSTWIDKTTSNVYTYATIASGLATWVSIGGATSDVNTLIGDSGGSIAPVAGQIDIAGGTNITTVGTAGTITANLDDSITLTGDIAARNINVSNTNITSFNANPILQSIATTGAAPAGTTGATNVMSLQDGVTMEEFILGAGQTIIAPRLADDGLLVSLDLTDDEGAEYFFGYQTSSKHAYTVGTDGAFSLEATFKVADAGGLDPLFMGFRKLAAPDAAFANYTDAAAIGIHTTTGADVITIGSNLNSAGWAYVSTTDAWADGETHKLKVLVSAAGVVTYLIDDVAPTVTQALTFDDGDVVIPYIHLLHDASPGAVHLQQLACGV